MSEKVIHYCDRCNKNQKGDGDKIHLALSCSNDIWEIPNEYELCKECSKSFLHWLKRDDGDTDRTTNDNKANQHSKSIRIRKHHTRRGNE